jgi:hypothetical protein
MAWHPIRFSREEKWKRTQADRRTPVAARVAIRDHAVLIVRLVPFGFPVRTGVDQPRK